MTTPLRTIGALLALLVLSVAAATGAAAEPNPGSDRSPTTPYRLAPYATIEGTGSTWSEVIVKQWIDSVDANGMRVVYTGGGSTKGRKDFANGTVDYAISEIPYQGVDENGNVDRSNRDYAYLPIVAGGTAFTYQLKIGNQQVKNLRLSGETIAKIFTNKITNWNDAAIAKDNNGREFPDLPITPVVRADGSGTTAQFTAWLNSEYSSIWRPYFGKSGLTSYYPRKDGSRMIGASGSDQVMNTIKQSTSNGTIGYVEYAYPKNANYPVVKVLNKAGYFVEPTQWNVAVALQKVRINSDLTQQLGGVYRDTDPRTYPLSSYSYMIIPTGAGDPRMTTAKRQTVADFLYHSLCAGQRDAGPYGYSPLTLNLVKSGFDQVAKLKKADPAVNLIDRDVRSCNNPTFDGKNLNHNVLADQAPKPPACDKVGEGPCGGDTGTGDPNTEDGTEDPAAPGNDGPGVSGPGSDDPGPGEVDPETGLPISDETTAESGGTVYADPTLVADRPGDIRTLGWFAVAELLALVLVPGLVATAVRRRRSPGADR